MRAYLAPEIGDRDVFGMNRVGVERGAVAKDRDEPRVVRARQIERVEADQETLYPRDDVGETPEQRDVLFAQSLLDIGAIFPDDNMSQHLKRNPSLESFEYHPSFGDAIVGHVTASRKGAK